MILSFWVCFVVFVVDGLKIVAGVFDMSSEFNLGAVQGRDNEDLPIGSANETGTIGERANGGYLVRNGIGVQGNSSIINIPANAERRVLTDRLKKLLSIIFI